MSMKKIWRINFNVLGNGHKKSQDDLVMFKRRFQIKDGKVYNSKS
jgi:hypothetical protein